MSGHKGKGGGGAGERSMVTYNKYGDVVDISDYTGSSNSYQQTAMWKYKDEESGSYANATVRDTASRGQLHKEKGSGRVGYKDEVKQTSTFRVGNKSGYTEYHYQERVTKVNFNNNKSLNK